MNKTTPEKNEENQKKRQCRTIADCVVVQLKTLQFGFGILRLDG